MGKGKMTPKTKTNGKGKFVKKSNGKLGRNPNKYA